MPAQTSESRSTSEMATSGRVEVRNLRKLYGQYVVLRETNLTVEPGELFTLLGPSGSGKSTILNIIAGFVPQSSGQVEIDGKTIDHLPAHRRNLGMVFQNYSLFPHMTVEENVAFSLELRRVPRTEVQELVQNALALVEMDGSEGKRPGQLSGGQQQRVALARALVFKPSVLLMDEPLSALDRKLRGQLQIELRAIQRRLQTTMIFVTHDQDEALTMSDRIAILNEGAVTQTGSPVEIYERPQAPFQAQFLGSNTISDGSVISVDNERARIRLADGFEVVGRSVGALPGQIAMMNIRAERVQVSDQASENSIPAVIQDVIYGGSEVRYILACSFSDEMVASVPNDQAHELRSEGTRVYVSWAADDLVCFPKNPQRAEP